MYAIINTSKFPIYFKKGRIVPFTKLSAHFKAYIEKIKTKKPAIIIDEFDANEQYQRRFLIEGKLIHPSLKQEVHMINQVYMYPCLEPQTFEEDGSMVLCLPLKLQRRWFIPFISLQTLDHYEIKALQVFEHYKLTSKEINIQDILEIIMNLNVQITNQKQMADETISLTLQDHTMHKEYGILIDKDGLLQETNVCYTPADSVYIWEAIMDFRHQGYIHIYSPYNYRWMN